MTAISVNHVNLPVSDIDESVEFVERVLGLERIPNIDSDAPGAWFEVGDAQLHLTRRESVTPRHHHVAFTVDNFVELYDDLVERGALDDAFGAELYELADGTMQMYFREPSGNLLEADWPDAEDLPRRIRDHATTREATFDLAVTESGNRATLFR